MEKNLDLRVHIDVPHLWRGILESYHNYHDVFSELIQNAVDSVRKAKIPNAKISVSYDNDTQAIIVIDNGTGISEDDLAFFALGNTNKVGEDQSIGEKGLGASFILGISDTFEIESAKDGKKIRAKCLNANRQIMEHVVPELKYSVEEYSGSNYCKISVQVSKIDTNISSFEAFKYMLRTKTAFGNTTNLFLPSDKRENIDISVSYKNGETEIQNEKLPFLYLHFDELVEGTYPIFDAEYSARSKKWLVEEAEIQRKPRGVLRIVDYTNRIYLTFAEASIYERFGGAVGKERYPDNIVVAIKGCPTSVEINKPRLGNAGYYTNLHVVIEGNNFTLDAGRKTITRANADVVRDNIRSFFGDVVKLSKYFLGTPHDAIGEGAGLDQIKERARSTDPLNISAIPFEKVPRHEQSVVAIFHELLGAKMLIGYKTLLVSQYNTFDILFDYTIDISKVGKNPREIYQKSAGKGEKTFRSVSFGEFKLEVSRFCDDVNTDIKRLDHVNLLICWEAGKIPNGWEFRESFPDEKIYDGAKYILSKIGHKSVHVILLRDFVDTK